MSEFNEPWVIVDKSSGAPFIDINDDNPIWATCYGGETGLDWRQIGTLERIAACINACEGFSTEELIEIVNDPDTELQNCDKYPDRPREDN